MNRVDDALKSLHSETAAAENAKAARATSYGECVRVRYWKELSIEEKIDRIRSVIKGEQVSRQQNERQIAALSRAVSRLRSHRHIADGTAVLALSDEADENRYYVEPIGPKRSEDPDAVYF